jgi:hypothetical protein
VSATTFEALKREEARQRMAALRRARKSPAAALREQRAASLIDGAAGNGRITNLRQMLEAMADYAPKPRKRRRKRTRSKAR